MAKGITLLCSSGSSRRKKIPKTLSMISLAGVVRILRTNWFSQQWRTQLRQTGNNKWTRYKFSLFLYLNLRFLLLFFLYSFSFDNDRRKGKNKRQISFFSEGGTNYFIGRKHKKNVPYVEEKRNRYYYYHGPKTLGKLKLAQLLKTVHGVNCRKNKKKFRLPKGSTNYIHIRLSNQQKCFCV